VFGAWTAWHLRRLGQRVLLLDASGPANMRASSGGESRMTRTIYGADDIYTRMALSSLDDWRWLSARGPADLPSIGVLMFFGKREPYAVQHRAPGTGLPRRARASVQGVIRRCLGRRRVRAVPADLGADGPSCRADAR
jgi:glycine/D-amino acid oxidase-like deaminating enzyme